MNFSRWFASVFAAVALAGCSSYTVRQPTAGAALPSGPVNVTIEWTGGQMSNFTATLDGANVASQFTVGSSSATAALPVAGGQHSFVTTADVYDPFYRRNIARSSTVPFSVTTPTPSITLNVPATAQAPRGGATSVTVTVTRSGGFAGAVRIDVSGPALTAASSTTLLATQTSTPVTLNVKADAAFGGSMVEIRASAMGITTRTENLSLRVLRQNGAFAVASFAVTTAGQTATSPNGAITLLARTGAQEAVPAAFAAVFRRGSTYIGHAIGYNHGATNLPTTPYGGAGFCAASEAGFVISGTGPGVSTATQFAVFLLDFSTGRLAPQADVASLRSGYYFQPRVWFSPDCSVAIAAGAHQIGPSNNAAQVIDVARSTVLGSFEFNATTFSASVTTTAGGAQQVSITADGTTRPPMTLP